MNHTARVFCLGLLLVAMFGLTLASLISALDQPDVYFSNSTGKCVQVIAPTNEGVTKPWSCDNLPKRYSKVYVY